jgi:hypothetical protein
MVVINTPVKNETAMDSRVPVSTTPLVVVVKVVIGIVLFRVLVVKDMAAQDCYTGKYSGSRYIA